MSADRERDLALIQAERQIECLTSELARVRRRHAEAVEENLALRAERDRARDIAITLEGELAERTATDSTPTSDVPLPEPDGVIVLRGQAWRGYTSETVRQLLAEATKRTREQVEAEVVAALRARALFSLEIGQAMQDSVDVGESARPRAIAGALTRAADAIARGEHRTPGGAG